MKELVAGKYFAKNNDVLVYVVLGGIGNFLTIDQFTVLQNSNVNSDDIKSEFMMSPESFTMVEESTIWMKPKEVIKKVIQKKETIKDDVDEISIPDLSADVIEKYRLLSEEEGRIVTIGTIMAELQLNDKVAALTYEKYF